MPSLGADMDAGTLVSWQIAEGAHVKRGGVVALVETEKGVIEVEVWETGIVERLLVQPGAKVPVGTVLATLDGNGSPRAEAPRSASVAPQPVAPTMTFTPTQPPAPRAPTPPMRASPAARQLAREIGVDLATVHGTGPHDAITRSDVVREAERLRPPVPKEDATPPPRVVERREQPPAAADPRAAMRRAIGAAMAHSKREIPHYYLSSEIELSRTTRWLEEQNTRRPVEERILFAAVLVKATALALRQVPELNGFFVEGAFRPGAGVHVGFAIAIRGGGLIAPAIHDADTLSLTETMSRMRDLVARARAGSLKSSELSDATITVTSLGEQGADEVFGVIYPPQVALVGFGSVRERPWAENGMLGVRPVIVASLSADHRASDGHRGARFLQILSRALEDFERVERELGDSSRVATH